MVYVKKITKGKWLFIRTILSSAVGYVFDTGLFVVLAFAGTVPVSDIVSMIVIQYFVKLIIEAIFATPLAYLVVGFLRKRVGDCHE